MTSDMGVLLIWLNSSRYLTTKGDRLKVYDLTADRLAQLVEYRTTVQEVVGSNPGWTNTQGL